MRHRTDYGLYPAAEIIALELNDDPIIRDMLDRVLRNNGMWEPGSDPRGFFVFLDFSLPTEELAAARLAWCAENCAQFGMLNYRIWAFQHERDALHFYLRWG